MADKSKQTNSSNRRVNCVEKMRTRLLDHYCNIEWRIDDFSKHYRDIYSDVITPYCDCRTKWKVAVQFFDGNTTMDISFKRCDGEKDVLRGTFHLSIENSSGQVYAKATVDRSDINVLSKIKRPTITNGHLVDYQGKNFKLMEDDVLVIKGAMDLKGCCTKTTCFVGFS